MSFGDRNVICCIGYLYCGGYDPNGQEDPSGGYHLSGEAFFLQAVHPQMNKSPWLMPVRSRRSRGIKKRERLFPEGRTSL